MKRAVIFGSAPVRDWGFLTDYFRPGDAVICADGGRCAAEKLGLAPSWYVGDNDSGGYPGGCPSDLLPSEKDDTDLGVAVSRALREGFDELLLCGCTGGREDHHLSALGQLERIYRAGKTGLIVDPQNEIRLLAPGRTLVPEKPDYRYFGIIPLDALLRDVTITGAKYEVSHADFYRYASLGVSNELMAGTPCAIELGEGMGLLIRSR